MSRCGSGSRYGEREITFPPSYAWELSSLPYPNLSTRHGQQPHLGLWARNPAWLGGQLKCWVSLSQHPACPQPPSPGTSNHHAAGFRPQHLAVGASAAVTKGTMILRCHTSISPKTHFLEGDKALSTCRRDPRSHLPGHLPSVTSLFIGKSESYSLTEEELCPWLHVLH